MSASPPTSVLSCRSRLNALVRHRGPDDPAVLDARRDLAAARLEREIRSASLDLDQRARLASLLLVAEQTTSVAGDAA